MSARSRVTRWRLAVGLSSLGLVALVSGIAIPDRYAAPPEVMITISDAVATETSCAGGNAVFTVQLSRSNKQTVSVDFSAADGTAIAGSDYTVTAGTLMFQPKERTKTIVVAIINDQVTEGAETFFVNLSNPQNANISDGQGVGTIYNDLCDDADHCTLDTCNLATRTCSHTPLDCNDGNVCTSDSCDSTAGCVHHAIDRGQTTCGTGACERTVQNCVDGISQSCTPGTPTAEVCNGIDDDCNGTIDGPGSEVSCSRANATPACSGGVCVIASCNAGFGDCDGINANGCEVNLSVAQTNSPDKFGGHDVPPGYIRVATITNCGGCGVPCDDGNSCTTDLCVPVNGVGHCRAFNRAMCAVARCSTDPFMVADGEGVGEPECAGPDSDVVVINGSTTPAPDGLPDAWETPQPNVYSSGMNPKGVDINCDGMIDGSNPNGPDLELPDSNPSVPDLYVAYDYMNASGLETSHKPVDSFYDVDDPGLVSNHTGLLVPGTIERVKNTFASEGIALHMFVNVNSDGVATSSDDPSTSLTPHKQVVTFCPDTSKALTADAITFDSLKTAHFDRRKRFTHKYAVYGHFVQCAGPGDCEPCTPEFCGPSKWQASGMAEMPGNDLVVSLGGPQYPLEPSHTQGRDQAIGFQTGTFLHELGHTIGLNHGGALPVPGDVCSYTPEQNRLNHKPNYISLMNYRYQFTGINSGAFPGDSMPVPAPYSASTVEGTPGFIPEARFDFSTMVLPTLNETMLDENVGVSDCAVTGLRDIIRYNPSTPVNDTSALLRGPGCGPVDWNGNFSDTFTYESGPLLVDTNRQDSDPILFDRALAGFDDWSFIFNHLPFQCTRTFSEAESCGVGFGDCDTNGTNGCETDLTTDVNNCGVCGAVCTVAHGTSSCVFGACGIASCTIGFDDCNGNPADGCETNLDASPNNCGACGNACSLPNATESCNAGVCGIAICDAGWGNCDSNPVNGCEDDLTAVPNCGSCGVACDDADPCTDDSCDPGSGVCVHTPRPQCQSFCAQIGQACETAPCCSGLICSRPELGECLGSDRTGCLCTVFVP